MIEYINPAWRKKLIKKNLISFENFWQTPNIWFEEVNKRRNGWSGVITQKIGEKTVFIKKQEDHNFKTWRHPIKGEPTFYREFKNIKVLQKLKIPTLEIVYFGIRKNQCILVTSDLNKDYISLERMLKNKKILKDIELKKICSALNKIHSHKIQHTYPIPKHIYCHKDGQRVVFIDLEKMKSPFFKFQCTIRDLYSFLKFTSNFMTGTQRKKVFSYYFKKTKTSFFSMQLMRYIEIKLKSKLKSI